MSEGDVSLIRDEDVLRRMWQQTEDFSRKKEIRAHMYRLREERLRNLYSPEPPATEAKGCQFTSAQGHVKSFADQTFQSMKSKEVRDAGSPPKEFTYRGQDLKELSNAGWTVESENKTTDDGKTHVKNVQATIEGRYDVAGGHGEFEAVDRHRQAVTDYSDDNTSLKRNESSSNIAAREQVLRQSDDGTHISSTTNSSTSTSKFQEVSSTIHNVVPYETDDYDLRPREVNKTNQSQHTMSKKEVTNDYEQNLRSNDGGELMSRKVEYPDEKTKVIVETRQLADGTRVTSTRREFRGPVIQSSKSEHHCEEARSESRSYHTSQQKSNFSESTTNSSTTRKNIDKESVNIVDSQKTADDIDFKQNHKFHHNSPIDETFHNNSNIENLKLSNNEKNNIQKHEQSHITEERVHQLTEEKTEDIIKTKTSSDHYETTYNSDYSQKKISSDWSPTHQAWASTLRGDTPTSTRSTTRASSPGGRTFQSSSSSLRSSVSPDKINRKSSSRGCSPSKNDRYSPVRTVSDKYSSTQSTRSCTETNMNRYTSPERKQINKKSPTRASQSPEKSSQNRSSPDKKINEPLHRESVSPDRSTYANDGRHRHSQQTDKKTTRPTTSPHRTTVSPDISGDPTLYSRRSVTPDRKTQNHEFESTPRLPNDPIPRGSSTSPERKPSYMKQTATSQSHITETTKNKPIRSSISPERKSLAKGSYQTQENKVKTINEDCYKLIDEETKMYTRLEKKSTRDNYDSNNANTLQHESTYRESPSPDKHYPFTDSVDYCQTKIPRSTLKDKSRSPSPPKGPVCFTETSQKTKQIMTTNNTTENKNEFKQNRTPKATTPGSPTRDIKATSEREPSPLIYRTYDKTLTHSKEINVNSNVKTNSIPLREKSPKIAQEPRKSISPVKLSGKETQDFIAAEKSVNSIKKATVKDHPRQLVTPSSSPTRKPKTDDAELSTGQSSPTTSVSGFIYFASPQDEKIIITDLDDHESYNQFENEETVTTHKRPESLDVRRSPTNSKTPCRSPSPEKRMSPTSENLPRKSSLKKRPSGFGNLISPIEKPPSSFKVSPTVESQEFPKHNIVKKDQPDKPNTEKDNKMKSKPPLERRETYDERCRKILGMMDDNKIKTTELNTNNSCVTPTNKINLDLVIDCKNISNEYMNTNDFITTEKKEISKTEQNRKSLVNTISRENSPTKLQDIIKGSDSTKQDVSTTIVHQEKDSKSFTKESEHDRPHTTRSSQSPDKKLSKEGTCSPDRKHSRSQPRHTSSPDRKLNTIDIKTQNDVKVSVENKAETVKSHALIRQETYNVDKRPTKESPSLANVSKSRTPSPCKIISKAIERTEDLLVSEREQTIMNRVQQSLRKLSPTRKETSPIREETSHSPKETSLNRNETLPKRDTTPQIRNDKSPSLEETPPKRDEPSKSHKYTSPSRKETSPSHKDTSPSRKDTSPSRKGTSPSLKDTTHSSKEKPSGRTTSPTKSSTSLHDIKLTSTEHSTDISEVGTHSEILTETLRELTKTESKQTKNDNKREHVEKSIVKKPMSRNISPVKKTTTVTSPTKSPELPTKSRSISPKKSFRSTERPQSPQVTKVADFKTNDNTQSTTTKRTLSPNKIDKTVVTNDTKKTIMTKQNSFNKSTISKANNKTTISKTSEPDKKQISPPKTNYRDSFGKKEIDSKVVRTVSDNSIKAKKSSQQRINSKPEIQISDTTVTKNFKQTVSNNRLQKPQTKFPNKPKSATALNTSTDDDDIIIDVQQAKSSRENSPDRICPTPVNFSEDIGTPRYPDEVNEPDDEFRNYKYNTIHEAESIVDDIVEICEDDELFVKKIDNHLHESDECLLSVNDKVSKFTDKIDTIGKTKITSKHFKDIERKEHSDFVDGSLKSDDCLLTVTEKVNKFAKGPIDTRDSKSPSRKIIDEYDNNTIYQDDYTKLSVNDKAHLFVETAENVLAPKTKPATKVERPDLEDVDELLKSDDCLLSVSDKVNKFIKTAEQFLTQSQETEEKERKIKEQQDIIIKKLVNDIENDTAEEVKQVKDNIAVKDTELIQTNVRERQDEKRGSFSKETASSQAKIKDYPSHNLKQESLKKEKAPSIKITTLRSSEAVKKAKALFENIASNQKNKETTNSKNTKLTDIGVVKISSKTDCSRVLHPVLKDESSNVTVETVVANQDVSKINSTKSTDNCNSILSDSKPRSSPSLLNAKLPDVCRNKSPIRNVVETVTVLKSVTHSHHPQTEIIIENDKVSQDKVPSYQRPTKTSQLKEEIKTVEESEVGSRRGSGKFGVELRRTSVERSTVSSERRRSVEHHQPCIEDIFDLDLLEQMLEKVVGYEQRRRIRSQIRIARKNVENNLDTQRKSTKYNTMMLKTKSPEPYSQARSPDRQSRLTPRKSVSPDRQVKPDTLSISRDYIQPKENLSNGHAKEHILTKNETNHRSRSPEKSAAKLPSKTKSPVRLKSPDKRTRTTSPSKTATPKPKSSRFSEYASAYLKKAGINDIDKVKVTENQIKTVTEMSDRKKNSQVQEQSTESTVTKSFTERKSSKDTINVTRLNGRRTPSPEKKQSPERKVKTPTERLREKSPSPIVKREISDAEKTETKNVYEGVKKTQALPKQVQEDKPSWITNRNLKKISSETRTFSSKKMESEKPKYRAPSPSKAISKPLDVITSSYGPGPLDANGKPLFGIKALRNGASNYQVKGTVIRQEFHSRNGGEPEGTVSVTAYSSSAEELERLLREQGERPSRLHGLAAITTTRHFGGETGNSYRDVHTKEERAALDQFTHNNRRVSDSRVEITDVTDTREDREHRLQERRSQERNSQEKTSSLVETSNLAKTSSVDRRTDRTARERSSQEKTSTQEKTSAVDRRTDRTARDRSSQEKRTREERSEKMERREDRKTVRQSSIKSLTEKYIKSASDTAKAERSVYPKAGLILRTNSRDAANFDAPQTGLPRADSDHSLGSGEESLVTSSTQRAGRTVTSTTTVTSSGQHSTQHSTQHSSHHSSQQGGHRVQERSFLDSSTKVSGVQDILSRMKNADIVIQEGDSTEDAEARALLNKFLGATVLMAGMQSYVSEKPGGKVHVQESVRTSSTSAGGPVCSSSDFNPEQCWDERLLRKLLDESTDYDQRRRLRARIRNLMAEQEACASAVTEALAAAGEPVDGAECGDAREEEEVTTVTSSVRRNSSEKSISSSTTTKTTKVIEIKSAPKPVSPFAKFRQLEKQNSTNSPNSPKTPQSPGSPSQPFFKFTDPVLQVSALTIKERLLQWCRDKTRDYENVKLENFSTSWADGLAFCALVHHFLPDAFDYSKLTPDKRRHNFTLAFKVADEKAGIYPLLDVDDMVTMRKPDWKCVFTYVQSIHRRFKDQS